jgi:phosphate transport system substrate-binding protein
MAGLAAALFAVPTFAADITGAGATFPYPIYAKWADAYKKSTGIGLNYQSIGSGGGIKQITAKTVDFGASDMPMKPEDLEKNGLMQFPAIMGGDVMVYNLKGVPSGAITLTGPLIADIYLGKIKKWNETRSPAEPRRQASRPGDLGGLARTAQAPRPSLPFKVS